MFPNTSKIDGKISRLRTGGATPKNSPLIRELLIDQAAAWFPGNKKAELAEEHLVERGMIPAKTKSGPRFSSAKLHKKVLTLIPRQ